MRKVHGTAKDEKDHGVAECRVEAFFEYHVVAADRFPALAAGAIRADRRELGRAGEREREREAGERGADERERPDEGAREPGERRPPLRLRR